MKALIESCVHSIPAAEETLQYPISRIALDIRFSAPTSRASVCSMVLTSTNRRAFEPTLHSFHVQHRSYLFASFLPKRVNIATTLSRSSPSSDLHMKEMLLSRQFTTLFKQVTESPRRMSQISSDQVRARIPLQASDGYARVLPHHGTTP